MGGASSQPSFGYDYDTFASDLNELMTRLDLSDAVLVRVLHGHRRGGRYLSRYGSSRINKVAFRPRSAVPAEDGRQPHRCAAERVRRHHGLDPQGPLRLLHEFYNDFYASTRTWAPPERGGRQHASFTVSVAGSAIAALNCVPTWLTDFRPDLPSVDVPALIVQSRDQVDRLLWRVLHDAAEAEYVEIDGAPHGIAWTHAAERQQRAADIPDQMPPRHPL